MSIYDRIADGFDPYGTNEDFPVAAPWDYDPYYGTDTGLPADFVNRNSVWDFDKERLVAALA